MSRHSQSINDLDDLAFKYDTDKKSDGHNYVRLYHPLFEPLRNEPITLLELGVAWGGSLRMWRDYFPQGNIIGVDTFLDCPTTPEALADVDVHLFQVDQQEPKLPELIAWWLPLDIVIDDCSHRPDKIAASFDMLWPLLTEGGVYAIEDLGIHDLPYQDLLNEIRKRDDTDVTLHASQHRDCYWWEIALITKKEATR